ncbi:MAG: hypothetical protein HZY76_18010 [Anaerolineae bacterium]|nr:MAG: hypothetical protein HZY76_18010 [Anaerolineae bacterium]
MLAAQRAGELPLFAMPEITVERPKRADQGDWATPWALSAVRAVNEVRLATGQPKLAPLQIAQAIANQIVSQASPLLAHVTAAPPGFVNFTLAHAWLVSQITAIRRG